MGGVELFYEIGKTHQDSELITEARKQLLDVIHAAHENTYRFGGAGGIGEFHLGLFRGISGVGYTILRQLNPQLPNVLIWE
jgi:lantibiotic modifying enzyme